MSARDLVQACVLHGVDTDALCAVLEAYAACLEEVEPHATGEIHAAHHIGLNVAEILEEADL